MLLLGLGSLRLSAVYLFLVDRLRQRLIRLRTILKPSLWCSRLWGPTPILIVRSVRELGSALAVGTRDGLICILDRANCLRLFSLIGCRSVPESLALS